MTGRLRPSVGIRDAGRHRGQVVSRQERPDDGHGNHGFRLRSPVDEQALRALLFRASGGNLVMVFAWLGIGFLLSVVSLGAVLRNPPPGLPPVGGGRVSDRAPVVNREAFSDRRHPGRPSVLSLRFATMWLVFFTNILAGISLISFQSPLFQDLWHSPNRTVQRGTGRLRCDADCRQLPVQRRRTDIVGGVSDRIGRVCTFWIMLASQIVAFCVLTQVSNPWPFGGLICYVLLCYGGASARCRPLCRRVRSDPNAARVRNDPHGMVGRRDRWPPTRRLHQQTMRHKLAHYAFLCDIVALFSGTSWKAGCATAAARPTCLDAMAA